MAKQPPRYDSQWEDTNGSKKSTPSNTPRQSGRDDGSSSAPRYTGQNTYTGPDKPSEGRSANRPPMSKKWTEK
jgi:hypothetical protein